MRGSSGSVVLSILFVSGIALFMFHNCAPARLAHQTFPAIGEVVQLKAAEAVNASKPDHEFKNILIYLNSGSQTLDYESEGVVQFFTGPSSTKPLGELTLAQLKDAHSVTGCSDELSRYLENAFLGDVMFCNGTMNLSKAKYFVYKRADGKTKTATSYYPAFAKEELDLLAITVDFN